MNITKLTCLKRVKQKNHRTEGSIFSFFECYLKAAETDNGWLALDKLYLISIEAGAL